MEAAKIAMTGADLLAQIGGQTQATGLAPFLQC
jgi:hypothetical protein